MSFEFAGNPNKMSAIIGSMNPANLGEVSYEGVMQDAYDDVAATRRNLAAEDTVSRLENEAEKAKMDIAYQNEIGAMERDAARTNAWIDAGLNVAGSGITAYGKRRKKTEFSQPVPGDPKARETIGGYDGDEYFKPSEIPGFIKPRPMVPRDMVKYPLK